MLQLLFQLVAKVAFTFFIKYLILFQLYFYKKMILIVLVNRNNPGSHLNVGVPTKHATYQIVLLKIYVHCFESIRLGM